MIEEPKEDYAEQVMDDPKETFQEHALPEGEQSLEGVADEINNDAVAGPENI